MGKKNRVTREKRSFEMMLTPSPCTGAVGYKKSEKTAYQDTFEHISGRYGIHRPAFSKIEYGKTDDCTREDGNSCSSEMGRFQYPFKPIPL